MVQRLLCRRWRLLGRLKSDWTVGCRRFGARGCPLLQRCAHRDDIASFFKDRIFHLHNSVTLSCITVRGCMASCSTACKDVTRALSLACCRVALMGGFRKLNTLAVSLATFTLRGPPHVFQCLPTASRSAARCTACHESAVQERAAADHSILRLVRQNERACIV